MLDKTLAAIRETTAEVKRYQQTGAAERLRSERRSEPFRMSFQGQWPLCGTQVPVLHCQWLLDNAPVTAATWPDEKAVTRLLVALTHGTTCALLGKRGTGKTQLAAWICQEWPAAGGQSAYFRACDLFGTIKSWYGLNEGRHTEWNKKQLVKVPLLVIDEVQESLGTEHDDKLLTEIIDKRYGERRSTLLISNLQPEAFAQRVGTSISSRITEGGTIEVFAGAGFRGRKA